MLNAKNEVSMKINQSHGGGGTVMHSLIEDVFRKHLGNELLLRGEDSAVFEFSGRAAFTTDSFVVQPLFFPGGDIGRLAVCGTVNDLLTAGAEPRYLSAAFILEEGLELELLERAVRSMAEAAREAGVQVVTGDTKVVEGRGGMLVNTAGLGLVRKGYDPAPMREGDAVLISGNLGEHHAAILSSRMGIQNSILSDCAPLCEMVCKLIDAGVGIRAMRDATRGGLATVLCELAAQRGVGIELEEAKLPVSREVQGFCGILGLDPIYMGNEGKMVFVVDGKDAERAAELVRAAKYGENAALVGRVTGGRGVVLKTAIGGSRVVAPLAGEGLPRIC
jgi:hydrogenase expression/formation protein HypE